MIGTTRVWRWAVRTGICAIAILAITIIFVTPRGAAQPEPLPDQVWSMGYFTPTGIGNLKVADLEWGALTHITYAWAIVQPDGTLDLATQRIPSRAPELIAVAHAHGVKVLLGIGQAYWKGEVNSLRDAAATNLPGLTASIMSVVNQYGFDGVDLDWEPFRKTPDSTGLTQTAASLRQALGKRLLSGAAIITESASWAAAAQSFDRIGIMTYDMTGDWNPYLWHNAALFATDNRVWSIDLAVARFHDAGIPLAKLSVGIPFFGYQWNPIANPAPQQPMGRNTSMEQVYYRDLAARISQQNYRWDTAAHVPFLSDPAKATFWTYDNERSVTDKARYVNDSGLGGWIIWELGADYTSSPYPSQPLLHAISEARKPLDHRR